MEHQTAADADRSSLDAALTLALTLPVDTLLYLLLPLLSDEFGVSLAEAGLLLGANRLVRIFGNRRVASFYSRRISISKPTRRRPPFPTLAKRALALSR